MLDLMPFTSQNPPPRNGRNRAAGQHFRRRVPSVGEQERDRGGRHEDQKTRDEELRLKSVMK